MTPERWQKIKGILDGVLAEPRSKRPVLVDQACNGDEDLRREIEGLLAREEETEAFVKPFFDVHDADPRLGDRIGPYRLLTVLGRGGMGTVYHAEREDGFEQRVALKLIKRGMDTDEIVRRFQHERQILATLEHASIARLLDGGTTDDGLPYFVMEHIEGEPIDRYCDAHRLSIDARLDLFQQLCAAVHVSHQSLVVHRDIKPSNILVTAEGVPKLLDFGIAKLLHANGNEGTLATGAGERAMSLPYASPEQVVGGPITTATDVYGLGVLLYHLLSGHSPYTAEGGTEIGIRRAICELKPMPPSTAVGRSETRENDDDTAVEVTPEMVSTARSCDTPALKRQLKGDLDCIVLKAMRKRPQERYRSADQLADDITRYRKGMPIIAQPRSFRYRAGKFIRRHLWQLAAAVLLALSFIAFLVIATALWQRAESGTAEAEAFHSFLKELFRTSDPNNATGEELTPQIMLDLAREKLLGELDDVPPDSLASINTTLGHVYRNLGRANRSRELLSRTVELLREADASDRELAEALNDVAAVDLEHGSYEVAERGFREASELLEYLSQDDDWRIRVDNNLAQTLVRRGAFDEAEKIFQRTLEARRSVSGEHQLEVGTNLQHLGTLAFLRGRFAAAEDHYRRALELFAAQPGENHTVYASACNNLGRLLIAMEKLGEAEPFIDEALAKRKALLKEDHYQTARARSSLALLHLAQGNAVAAEEQARRALEVLHKTRPAGHWHIADAESILGASLLEQERSEEAEPLLRRSHEEMLAHWSESSTYVKDAAERLTRLYR